MHMIKMMSIAGARPNFMKLAAIVEAIEERVESKGEAGETIQHLIVHTGQHYDVKMSKSFFEDLELPAPDINLEVGSGSHGEQVAEIMKRFEPVLLEHLPHALLVVGDVNSTIACSLVAAKVVYPEGYHRRRPLIVHVEAGLRSFDREMPEEVNRVLTDSISDVLFVTEESGVKNLKAEGVAEGKIHFVGNVMIDTLQRHLEKASQLNVRQELVIPERYVIMTFHRPSNVDDPSTLEALAKSILEVSERCHVVFPVHPRTEQNLKAFGLWKVLEGNANVTLTEPLGYLQFLNLMEGAAAVVTDSGGIQEETTVLRVPCITLRANTERPVTVEVGSNYLIGTDASGILPHIEQILESDEKKGEIPPLWDGKAGQRIIDVLCSELID